MTWQHCQQRDCTARAHVLIDGRLVCWTCWNRAVLASATPVKGKMLRRYWR